MRAWRFLFPRRSASVRRPIVVLIIFRPLPGLVTRLIDRSLSITLSGPNTPPVVAGLSTTSTDKIRVIATTRRAPQRWANRPVPSILKPRLVGLVLAALT